MPSDSAKRQSYYLAVSGTGKNKIAKEILLFFVCKCPVRQRTHPASYLKDDAELEVDPDPIRSGGPDFAIK
jgi:hypothetical protein